MDEDRLSPQLGRLIDEAKAASLRVDPAATPAEGVALLCGDGSVYSASAAQAALASARRAGATEILAAAVAVANDPSSTLLPSAESRACLAGIDPDLPLVVKQFGRWVLVALSKLPDHA